MNTENYQEYGAAYVEEKYKSAGRAAKSFVKNLFLINLLEKSVRIEYDGLIFDVEATPVEIEEV